MVDYLPIQKEHLDGVVGLCKSEGWPSFPKNPERAWRVLAALGVTTVVAVDSGQVVGFVQMQSDGEIQAHLSLIVVMADRRREGIGTRMVTEAFARCGAQRIDLITEDAPAFYRSFAHKEWTGLRIYPQLERGGAF